MLLFNTVHSQNLESLKDAKPITVTGGLNVSGSAQGAIGTELNRDSYYWQLSANMNFNIYGVLNLPFSAIITKENKTFNQPSFREFGMSPQYKSITLHLGYRNMSFSNYSLSGITFLGVGIEYAPENIPIMISAMYGRFKKAIQFTDLNDIEDEDQILEDPAYERWGYGSKITIGKQNQSVDLIFFKAEDKINSLIDTVEGLSPEEGIVFGINTRNNITKNLKLNIELTNSTHSYDTRLTENDFESYEYMNKLGNLYTPRLSSQVKNSIVSKLSYQFSKANFGLMYRKVDPDYISMGTPGIVGDIEEYTINLSANLLKDKLNFTGALGSQKDNLDKKEPQANKRLISSINLNYTINESLNFSTNYSNFSAKILPVRISFADSIKYLQVTENFSLVANYKFGRDSAKHSLTIVNNYQTANTVNRTLTDTMDINTKVYYGNINYQYNITHIKLSVNASVNYSNFNTDDTKSSSIGPTVGISKTFFNNKIRSNFNYSYFITKSTTGSDQTNNRPINNFSSGLSYTINKHHSFRFNARYLFKKGEISNEESKMIHKYQTNLMYNFTF